MLSKRDRLIELIEQSGIICDNCPDYDCSSWAEHCADHILENAVTVQEWISVEDRLPENDYGKHWKERQQYLVLLQNGTMRVARYGYKEHEWWIDSIDCVLSKARHTEVTHWQPTPEPPKGE